MTVRQLIDKELSIIYPSILQNRRVELSTDDIMDFPNSDLFEELNKIKGAPGIDNNEWDSLYDFLLLVDYVETPDSALDIEKEFNLFIEKYPGIRTFQYLKIYYITMEVIAGDVDGNSIIDFYRDVLENHFELVCLDDFFHISNLLVSILLLNEPSSELIKVIEEAVNNYPRKAILKFTIGQLYHRRNNIDQALNWNLKFLSEVQSEINSIQADDTNEPIRDYTIEDYHISLSSVSHLFYLKTDFDYALEYSNMCLQEFKKRNEDIYSFHVLFFDPMLTRLRVFIQQRNEQEFIKDYNLIKPKITEFELESDSLKDIVEFANELKM